LHPAIRRGVGVLLKSDYLFVYGVGTLLGRWGCLLIGSQSFSKLPVPNSPLLRENLEVGVGRISPAYPKLKNLTIHYPLVITAPMPSVMTRR